MLISLKMKYGLPKYLWELWLYIRSEVDDQATEVFSNEVFEELISQIYYPILRPTWGPTRYPIHDQLEENIEKGN